MITGNAIVAASVVTASKINIADRTLRALNAVNGAEKQIVCHLEMLTEIEHIQHQITEQNEKIRQKMQRSHEQRYITNDSHAFFTLS